MRNYVLASLTHVNFIIIWVWKGINKSQCMFPGKEFWSVFKAMMQSHWWSENSFSFGPHLGLHISYVEQVKYSQEYQQKGSNFLSLLFPPFLSFHCSPFQLLKQHELLYFETEILPSDLFCWLHACLPSACCTKNNAVITPAAVDGICSMGSTKVAVFHCYLRTDGNF